ncbi:MAG: TRAP transporter fused permease subunit [Acidiferrobacterales bacterium]|nr:TRAP transporter fused permease subunit [Acidiferrobacterales bacterium]
MSRARRLRSALTALFLVIGTALTLYIGISVFGLISNSKVFYATFVFLVMCMASLHAINELIDQFIAGSVNHIWRIRLAIAAVATVLAVGGSGYVRFHALRLDAIHPFFETFDITIGILFIVGVMMLNFLHWGWLLTSLVVIIILYFFFGYLVPYPILRLPEYDVGFVIHYLGLGVSEGMFWLARLAADKLYFLVIFAAILLGVGMLKMVIEIGKVTGRRVQGGAAFPAIIGSGIVASVMGQAVSNVVLTGRLTIPMMKSHGYRKDMAGAIEAVASTSGQIMPPILGLAGFIIALFLNVPYIEVALAALIPALLFLSGTTFGVITCAQSERLEKMQDEIDYKAIWRMAPTFLVSFAAVVILLVGYYSPAIAGIVGIALALGLCMFQGRYRPKIREMYDAFLDGLVIVTLLSLLLVAIGPLAQTFLTTNLSNRLAIVLVQVLPDSKILLLVGTMVVSLFLGMGLPTPVAYVVVSLTLVPFLQQGGIDAILAHFFVFYFAVFSTLTPPVAVSALAAAKLSGGTFLGTAKDGMKLMLTTFIIPYGFIYHPELLSFPDVTPDVIAPVVLILCLQWTSSVVCYGYFFRDLTWTERWGYLTVTAIGFSYLINERLIELIAFGALLIVMVGWVLSTRKRRGVHDA